MKDYILTSLFFACPVRGRSLCNGVRTYRKRYFADGLNSAYLAIGPTYRNEDSFLTQRIFDFLYADNAVRFGINISYFPTSAFYLHKTLEDALMLDRAHDPMGAGEGAFLSLDLLCRAEDGEVVGLGES